MCVARALRKVDTVGFSDGVNDGGGMMVMTTSEHLNLVETCPTKLYASEFQGYRKCSDDNDSESIRGDVEGN